MLKQINIFISGRVQGVGFRYSAWEKAGDLNLTGWVRNLPNGDVEILAEGDENKLNTFLKWTQQGSVVFQVNKVDYEWLEATDRFKDFKITSFLQGSY